ncbi:MAG: hypothetical protein RLZZ127_1211 [Planctomycetota bacterium]|jgi:uncharacterized membrane protein
MDTHILAIQAQVLRWTGLAMLAIALWLGTDPLAAAWRAAIGAVLAMWVAGWGLRRIAAVMQERIAADLAERQMAAEQAAQQAAEAAAKAKPKAPAPPPPRPRPAR